PRGEVRDRVSAIAIGVCAPPRGAGEAIADEHSLHGRTAGSNGAADIEGPRRTHRDYEIARAHLPLHVAGRAAHIVNARSAPGFRDDRGARRGEGLVPI